MSNFDAAKDAEAVARTASAAMHASDHAAQHLGIAIETVAPGFARLSMTVAPYMVNGLDVCHGGFVFVLADTAMAHASNSHNQMALAANASIDWLKPGYAGDVLTAEAREQTLSGRTGLYDVRITNGAGELIALFRGKTRQMGKPLVESV
ncbi:MAG: hydroxyphenylacetyl-CoA thioesterase PaaI [Pseudomonadota bacterium]